jgi:hypothetical protein
MNSNLSCICIALEDVKNMVKYQCKYLNMVNQLLKDVKNMLALREHRMHHFMLHAPAVVGNDMRIRIKPS